MKKRNNFKEYKKKGASFLEGNKKIVFFFMLLLIILGIVKIYYAKNKSLYEEQKTMEVIDELTSNSLGSDEGSRVYEAIVLTQKQKKLSIDDSLQLKKINGQLDKALSQKRSKSSLESTIFSVLIFIGIIGAYFIIRKKITRNNLKSKN